MQFNFFFSVFLIPNSNVIIPYLLPNSSSKTGFFVCFVGEGRVGHEGSR